VYPFTYICKNVVIGQRCRIGPFAYIKADAKIEDDVEVSGMVDKAGLFSRIEG
jgi:UDP-3-O-[3-hydroxymyristoyl] glucosamine N-acyltransferase